MESKRSETDAPRFLVDGMLGSLATKLRILGFDALYDKSSSDKELTEAARDSGRYLITSDIELFLQSRKKGVNSIIVESRNDLDALVELYSNLGFKEVDLTRDSRCAHCNGTLALTERKTTEGRDIYTCTSCRKEYWKGSHWRKLGALFRSVDQVLKSRAINNHSESKIAAKKSR